MSEKLNQCRLRMKEGIETAEGRLKQAGEHLVSTAESGAESIESHLKQAVVKCEAEREHAAKATERIKQFLVEAKDTTLAKFEEWKIDREIEKIESEADKAEEHAIDAIVVAAFAIAEAEVAIVKALRARKFALEVAG